MKQKLAASLQTVQHKRGLMSIHKKQITSKNKRKRKKGKKDIDWEKSDEEVLKKVKDILPELLDENIKPIRITKGLIGRKIGEVTLIQKKLDNIPKSKELINSIVESIEDYQKRRVVWVKNNCFNNEIATESKVKRKAGIKNLKHKMYTS